VVAIPHPGDDPSIVAAALAIACDRVYTEDVAHGQVVDGLAIIPIPPTASAVVSVRYNYRLAAPGV
jgi:hypothetical protein